MRTNYIYSIILSLDGKGGFSVKKVDSDSRSGELDKYLSMGIPVDEAKRAISSKSEEVTPLSAIGLEKAGELVNLECKLLTINEREVNLGDEPKKAYYGFLVDDTGSLPYTSWRDIPYEKGQSVVIKKGLVREWKGKAEIVINRQSALLKSDKQFKTIQLKKERKKIGDIKTPGWVTTVGRVLSRDDREKNGKRFTRGVIGDETGRMPFTSWVDFNFREGDVVEISGMVRSWLGLLSLNIGESSEVRESQEELDSSRLRVTIGGLEDRGMAFDILVEGDLVEIQKGSGLIVRCPICRRAIKGNNCAVHGEVDGVWDLRLKGVLDDGGGNLSMIIGKDLCEALLGKKLEELKEEAKDAMDTQVVLHEMEEKLLFNRYEAIGDVRSDEFGLRMIVRSIKSAEGGDPREMAQALLGGLG